MLQVEIVIEQDQIVAIGLHSLKCLIFGLDLQQTNARMGEPNSRIGDPLVVIFDDQQEHVVSSAAHGRSSFTDHFHATRVIGLLLDDIDGIAGPAFRIIADSRIAPQHG